MLLDILRENIRDNRFLRLIAQLLRSGYLENWKLNATYSGTPQGGVVSPILANIYMDTLDRFTKNLLVPDYNLGGSRRRNREYQRLGSRAKYLRRTERAKQAAAFRPLLGSLPYGDTHDPDDRRLRYIR